MPEKSLTQKSWQLFEQNRWAEAAQAFDQLLEINRTNEGGLQGKIAALRKQQKFSEAGSLIRQALKIHPESVGVLCERAWLALEQQKYDDAIEAFGAVLRRTQKDETLFLWKISLLRRQQRLDEAEEAVEEAKKLFPQSTPLLIERGWLYFYQNRFEQAADIFSDVLKLDENNEAAMQGRIASLRLRGQYTEARRQAERALNQRPNSPGILSERGWLEFEQDQYEDAEKSFSQVVEINRDDPYARVNLAWSLERQDGKEALAQASKYCLDALAIEPNLPEARGCLGVVAFKQGRIREAEIQLRRSITVDPKKGHYADLGALYIQMGRYDEAEGRLKEGLAVKSEDPALHLQLGNLYLQTDRLKDATSEFRQAAAIDPTHSDPPRALAISLMESGKIVEAESVLRNAIRRFDEFKRWRLHLTLCQVLTRMAEESGDGQLFEEALKEVNVALRLQPQHADAHFHAGIVRFKLDDYRRSLKAFQRCLEADKGRVDAEINARRVRGLIQQEKVRSRASAVASFIVGFVVFLQLVAIWMLRWLYGASESALVTTTMITVLVPVCLGLLVISVVLPWLSKLKLTGLEAELSEPKPKEALASGPKGEIGFGNASRTIGLAH
jgi:tetratricopeptide (TPR) repeat protein